GLISAILGVVIAIFVVLSVAAISTQNESATVVFGLLILVVGIAAGVLAIIAYILQIVGLKNASHDDNSFYTAFVFAIIGLVLTVLATIFSSLNVANGFGDDIASLFTKFSTIIITAFVIIGVSNLAGKLEQSAMAKRAKSVGTLQIVILALSIVASIIALFTGNAATIISGVLGLIASLLTVVFAIVYLVFLGKAKKMLKEN
ncbi:MAG: hypothetical protein Q4D15_08400, partial [Lachnospiraceae bacterium]|nr:hypothetical protein [Lachnospiraceae bacterium]